MKVRLVDFSMRLMMRVSQIINSTSKTDISEFESDRRKPVFSKLTLNLIKFSL